MPVAGCMIVLKKWVAWRAWYWWVAGVALAIHAGTFALRLPVFWPTPALLDFGAFYAAAWALRLGELTYKWSPALRSFLAAQGVNPDIAVNSFPIWPWLLQPMTWLPFAAAAWLWLAANVAVLAWCSRELARLAGVADRRGQLIVFALSVTFGPVALTLTLGQTSILLLALVLWIGRTLRQDRPPRVDATGALLWVAALATKLFPLAWIGGLACLGAWRTLARAVGGLALCVVLHALFVPQQSYAYLTDFLFAQAQELTDAPGINDQSLISVVWHMTQPLAMDAPGITLTQRDRVEWTSAWAVDPALITPVALGVLALVGLGLAWLLWRRRHYADAEGQFYLWVLFSLVVFPHTERYNHTLLLPALAWLWGQERRPIAAAGYCLVALSRLTYLWARILPAPWGPLLTGSALLATIVLGVGMVVYGRESRPASPDLA